MKFSIITVCFNSEKTIQNTLESVWSQNFLDMEHIIIDGNSSDGTMEIVQSYSKKCNYPVIIKSECDQGIYDAMNKGLTISSGNYVSFLNSDDIYASTDVLKKISQCDGMVEGKDILYGDVILYDSSFQAIKRNWVTGQFKNESLWLGWMAPHPSLFIKGDLHKKFLFDSSFKIQSDYGLCWDLFNRAAQTSYYYNFVSVHMRMGGASNSGIRSIIAGNLEAYKLLKKRKIKFKFFIIITKLFRKIFQFRR